MALNRVAYTWNVVRSILRYQLTAYPFSDPRLHAQMRALLSLDETRRSPPRCVDAVEDEDGSGADARAAFRTLSGEELGEGGWPEALHAALSRNELVFRLNEELRSPRALEELPEVIESAAGRPVTEAEVLA